MSTSPIMRPRTKIYFDYFVQQWNNHDKSMSRIADDIMEIFGVLVNPSSLVELKRKHHECFEPRDKAISAQLSAQTNMMNKLLKSNRRRIVERYLNHKK